MTHAHPRVTSCILTVKSVAVPASPSHQLLKVPSRPTRYVASRSPTPIRMGMQEIVFKIYPDGRVEERVTGMAGASCHKVTNSINAALGEVYETEATAEALVEENLEHNVNWDYNSGGSDADADADLPSW